MDHSEALQQMAAERYLLNELTPELREAFEEHFFDCPECALDLRAGAAFVEEAKAQLPELTAFSPAPPSPAAAKPAKKRSKWFFWGQPAFALPAFAVLLAVIGYQNLATIPSLRSAATEPRLLPWVTLHAGTRGAAHTPVLADRERGAVLLVELSQQKAYTSYVFELYDSQNKRLWSQSIAAYRENGDGGATVSLLIPGSGLQQSSYTLCISGINSPGGRTERTEQTEIDRRVLDIHFSD